MNGLDTKLGRYDVYVDIFFKDGEQGSRKLEWDPNDEKFLIVVPSSIIIRNRMEEVGLGGVLLYRDEGGRAGVFPIESRYTSRFLVVLMERKKEEEYDVDVYDIFDKKREVKIGSAKLNRNNTIYLYSHEEDKNICHKMRIKEHKKYGPIYIESITEYSLCSEAFFPIPGIEMNYVEEYPRMRLKKVFREWNLTGRWKLDDYILVIRLERKND